MHGETVKFTGKISFIYKYILTCKSLRKRPKDSIFRTELQFEFHEFNIILNYS